MQQQSRVIMSRTAVFVDLCGGSEEEVKRMEAMEDGSTAAGGASSLGFHHCRPSALKFYISFLAFDWWNGFKWVRRHIHDLEGFSDVCRRTVRPVRYSTSRPDSDRYYQYVLVCESYSRVQTQKTGPACGKRTLDNISVNMAVQEN
jgi:hypothetical protein